MKFCEKCGTSMHKNFKEKKYECGKCGNYEPLEDRIEISRTVNSYNKRNPEEMLVVIPEGTDLSPVRDINCPKCGHKGAYYREIPPRWLDEDGLTIYKCKECGHTWREGFSY